MPNRPALIVAHPGHELVLFGWMQDTRPIVSVLTDGSGRDGVSRLPSTLKVLREAGAEPGDLVGLSDPQFYAAVLERRVEMFVDLAVRFGDELRQWRPPYVVGDAREGFNPAHDICAMLIAAAVERARRGGVAIRNYSFALFGPQHRHARDASQAGICWTLTEDQLGRKIATAHAYSEIKTEVEWALNGRSPEAVARYPDVARIFDAAIDGMSERSFAMECLVPAGAASAPADPPFYELYAEYLLAEGKYDRAIRYREHVRPIERALAGLVS